MKTRSPHHAKEVQNGMPIKKLKKQKKNGRRCISHEYTMLLSDTIPVRNAKQTRSRRQEGFQMFLAIFVGFFLVKSSTESKWTG